MINRITIGIDVFVERERLAFAALKCIHRPEPPLPLVVVAGAVVINAERGIELLAGEEVVVGRGAGLGDQVAEGLLIVIVGVGDSAGAAGEEAHGAVAVEAVETGVGSAGNGLALADQLQSI